MSRNGLSVARFVVVLGLAIQILGLARLIFLEVGLARWIASVQNGFGPSVAASAVFLACLALLYPAGRGRRWALVATVPVQLLLTWTGIPIFIDEFPRPAGGFANWLTFTTLFITGVVATALGVLASLEAFGRTAPVGFRAEGGGLTRRGGAFAAVVFAWVGMVILGYAVASAPGAGATFPQPPEKIIYMTMEHIRFQPNALVLPVGKAAAIFITNRDGVAHSFDIDSLNIHVDIPGKSTAMALVTPPAGGQIPFYCGVADHRQTGMVGAISSQ